MHGEASVECDRCDNEMTTLMGSTYSRWMAKKLDDDSEVHCQACRADLSDPSDRKLSLDLEIDPADETADITVALENPTEETVGFDLSTEYDVETAQWNDDNKWQTATEETTGVVGVLTIVNEADEVVFEHLFRRWFSRHGDGIPSTQTLVDGERTLTLTTTWTHPDTRDLHDVDAYLGQPTTAPTDHTQLTALFDLSARPRGDWPERTVTTVVEL